MFLYFHGAGYYPTFSLLGRLPALHDGDLANPPKRENHQGIPSLCPGEQLPSSQPTPWTICMPPIRIAIPLANTSLAGNAWNGACAWRAGSGKSHGGSRTAFPKIINLKRVKAGIFGPIPPPWSLLMYPVGGFWRHLQRVPRKSPQTDCFANSGPIRSTGGSGTGQILQKSIIKAHILKILNL